MAEVEPLEGISVRKLVLETAKFNVITSHSVEETLILVQKYPNIEALVLHSSLPNLNCQDVVARVKKQYPRLAIIVLTPSPTFHCDGADHHVSSYEPEELLRLLRSMFGDPRAQEAA